ncbi:MAG: transporter [Candidatus Omnitrophica bacterium]|nr:transporter [Candidatus Omnitrophota bacterium]
MRHLLRTGLVMLFLSVGVVQVFAGGSGAYRIEVPDAAAVSMGSAFAGQANTPAAVYYNPAGMTQMVGQAISMNVSVIEPHETYKGPQASTAVQMKRGDIPIPSFFYVTKLTEKIALGIGTTTAFGLTTEWNVGSFAQYNATRTAMTNHDYYFALAYKLNEQWSFATGLDIDQSTLDQSKKLPQSLIGGTYDANMRLLGKDTAPGFRVAAMYKINEQHQVGVMYRSAIHHNYKGKVHLDNLQPGVLGAGGTFGAASYQSDVTLKSTLPQAIVIGYSYKPNQKWTLNADVEWTDWSSTQKIDPQFAETNPTKLGALKSGYPISQDWHSAFGLSLGAEYAMSDRLRLRGGSYFHQTPIPTVNWDPSIPDANRLGLCTGFGYDVTKNMTLDMGWTSLFYQPRKVNNNVADPLAGQQIDGTYRQYVNLLHATMSYKF